MDQRSVFYQEWLQSLREQYKHIVRSQDQVTLPTLTAVMQNIGFGEDELAQLKLEATMHVDDAGANYRADLDILKGLPHPAECLCPQCQTIDESQFDLEGQPIEIDPEAANYQPGQLQPVASLEEIDVQGESEPVTFEDGLVIDEELVAELAGEAADAAEADSDQPEDDFDDPDSPQQMDLF